MASAPSYQDVFSQAASDYAAYFLHSITTPSWKNYIYALLVLSLVVYGLELIFPWRKQQRRFRRDFWLDAFYTLFNFSIFSLLGYHALATVVEHAFVDLRTFVGIETLAFFDVRGWPTILQLALLLVLRDFVHYWIHRLLHRLPFLWRFHRVHHSVREMGFAAHLRYHWAETIVYRTLEYLPLGLIGFGLQEFFAVHLFTLTIGHLNHANIRLPLGPFRYLFNSPQMHLWHHARVLPAPYGANFGLTLSVWDWLFGTVHWPKDDANVELGFEQLETYPDGFLPQMIEPFRRADNRSEAL